MSDVEKKVLWVNPPMYTALRIFLRDHEEEYGSETARMAFLQLGIPEQSKGTEVRVIVDFEMEGEFMIEPDVGQSSPQPNPIKQEKENE